MLGREQIIGAMNASIANIFPGLRRRVFEIINYNMWDRKIFNNREGCLPLSRSNKYYEYGLTEMKDMNRIVVQGNISKFTLLWITTIVSLQFLKCFIRDYT